MIHMGYLYVGYERIVCYERKTKDKKGEELVIIFKCCQDKLNTINSKFYLVVSLDFCNTLGVKLSTKNIIFISFLPLPHFSASWMVQFYQLYHQKSANQHGTFSETKLDLNHPFSLKQVHDCGDDYWTKEISNIIFIG